MSMLVLFAAMNTGANACPGLAATNKYDTGLYLLQPYKFLALYLKA